MNLYIHHPQYPGLRATDAEVKQLFGLGVKDKWPQNGADERTIQGIRCWVAPWVRGGGFRLRAMCACPKCDKEMPIGRLAQHSKIHAL